MSRANYWTSPKSTASSSGNLSHSSKPAQITSGRVLAEAQRRRETQRKRLSGVVLSARVIPTYLNLVICHHCKAGAAPGAPSAFPIRRTAPSMAVTQGLRAWMAGYPNSANALETLLIPLHPLRLCASARTCFLRYSGGGTSRTLDLVGS